MEKTDQLLLDALDKKLLGASLQRMYDRDRSTAAVYLLCVHEWGNIGDLAINYNEVAFLERLFPEREVFSVSRSALAANWQRIRATVTNEDLIAIHGGGNLGDIWPHEEAARQAVVEAFPNNRIVSLPQSIHFDDAQALSESMSIYDAHPRMLLALRDSASVDLARTHLERVDVVRAEDIVTRHEYPFSFLPSRDHVLAFMRDDAELRPGSQRDVLLGRLEDAGISVERSDTTVEQLSFSNTELAAKLVYQKIDQAHAASLVVTDRLHGALFSLIAGRPVLVFENSYGKIGRALEHLAPKMRDYVHFADDNPAQWTPERVRELMRLPDSRFTPAQLLAEENEKFSRRVLQFATG